MEERPVIRNRAQILITNPDMMHCSILPMHSSFSRILSNLFYCVVDEAHTYKGVFGCHVSLVFRRLQRLCHHVYNSHPVFAMTTATIANPAQHAMNLLGISGQSIDGSATAQSSSLVVIDKDGSPHGEKEFVLWNPPLIHLTAGHTSREKSLEKSSHTTSAAGGGGGLGGSDGVKAMQRNVCDIGTRAQQELRRARIRSARQERHSAVLHSSGLASGRATEKVPIASKSAGGKLQKMTQKQQQQLAAEAAAALSSVTETATRNSFHNAVSSQSNARITRKATTLLHAMSVDMPHADTTSTPMASNSHAQILVDRKTVLHTKARYGTTGVNKESRRSSPIVELSFLLAECVQHGLRTIAFCKTRKLSELVVAYTREILAITSPERSTNIAVYRAGYSPSERRDIESALFSGRLLAVAATNALELGIDVGGLDCTLHLGFPGTIASMWQQAGRAGRREQPSLSIYVAWEGPLDQYFMSYPSRLFSRPIEAAAVDPLNNAALDGHLACAAAELPLNMQRDRRYFAASFDVQSASEEMWVRPDARYRDRDVNPCRFESAVQRLMEKHVLGKHPVHVGCLHYIGVVDSPASTITLRAIDPGRFAVVNESADGAIIEEIEESKAFFSVYDGAVYMSQGRTYLCKKLDLHAKVAIVRPADLKYYTKTIDYTQVTVVGGNAAYLTNDSTTKAACGKALVTTRWLGFVRVWRGTGQVFDTIDLYLPDVAFETVATYIRLPACARTRVESAGLSFRDGVHAAAHAVLNVLPLFMMCNAGDVGTECDNPYDTRYKPERILIYDKHPGGIGLAEAAQPLFTDILGKAHELIASCDCTDDCAGCPGCIQHTDCGEYNAVLHKAAGKIILAAALESASSNN